MNLLKEVKKYRDEMVARNYPFQAISDIITKYELDNPSVELKNDDRGPLDLTFQIESKDKEIADLKHDNKSLAKQVDDKTEEIKALKMKLEMLDNKCQK